MVKLMKRIQNINRMIKLILSQHMLQVKRIGPRTLAHISSSTFYTKFLMSKIIFLKETEIKILFFSTFSLILVVMLILETYVSKVHFFLPMCILFGLEYIMIIFHKNVVATHQLPLSHLHHY
jgi:hypothetical protein